MRETLNNLIPSPRRSLRSPSLGPSDHSAGSHGELALSSSSRVIAYALLAAAAAIACSSSDDGESDAGDTLEQAAVPSAQEAPAAQLPAEQATEPVAQEDASGGDTQGAAAAAPNGAAPSAGPAPAAQPAAVCNLRQTFDDEYRAIVDDISLDAQDAEFFRYVSLGNRANLGLCSDDLQVDRAALVETINSLSTQAVIVQPQPIGANSLLYRIDIRDLGWDQPTVVGGVAFSDKWEAIVAASPYAIEFEGDDADIAKRLSGTTIPVLSSDALIDAATVGDLYYALIDVGNNAFGLFAQLGIDFFNDDIVRVGTNDSSMSQQDTLINRFDVPARRGFYWSRLDIAANTAADVLSDPLGFPVEAAPALFTLPNGMLGYALFNAQFATIAETDVLVDRSERDSLMRNGVSCSGCHFAGVLPVNDQVLPYMESNPLSFDADTLDQVEEEFLPQSELNGYFERDNAAYRATLESAGLGGVAGDPLSRAYRRFDEGVTLAIGASELGVTPDELDREFGFDGTRLSREQFDGLFLEMVCVLHVSSANRPLAAECAAFSQ